MEPVQVQVVSQPAMILPGIREPSESVVVRRRPVRALIALSFGLALIAGSCVVLFAKKEPSSSDAKSLLACGGSSTASIASGGNSDYDFVVSSSTSVTFTTCGSVNSFDTTIEVLNDAGARVGFNDDSCGLLSNLQLNLGAGRYTVRVRGFGSSSGSFTLRAVCAIGCGSVVTGTTVGAANNFAAGLGNPAGDVSFVFSTNVATTATFTTCGGSSNYDTFLRLVQGTTEIASNDDSCGLQSRIVQQLAAGQTTVVVDGFQSSVGAFTLTVTCAGGINVLGAITVGTSVSGSTVGAANSFGQPSGDAIYSFTPPFSGQVTLNTCGSNFDTFLHVFNAGTEIASNDDSGACAGHGLLSQVVFNAVAGTNYLIVVEGFSTLTGAYVLNSAIALPNSRGSLTCGAAVSGTNVGATNTVGFASGDAVYDIQVAASQTVTLTTCGSQFDTVLRVFAGGHEISSNDDSSACAGNGLLSTVTIPASASARSLQVVVEGFSTSAGAYSLQTTCA